MVNSVSWLLLRTDTEGPNPIHLIECIHNIQAFLHYIPSAYADTLPGIVNVGERFTRRDIIVAAVQGRR